MRYRYMYIDMMSYDNDLQYQCFDFGNISVCCDRGFRSHFDGNYQGKLRLFYITIGRVLTFEFDDDIKMLKMAIFDKFDNIEIESAPIEDAQST